MKSPTQTILASIATIIISGAIFSHQAQATPITGSISFSGTGSASGDSSVNSPTTVSFNNDWVTTGLENGDYALAGIPAGVTTIFTAFTFTGDGASVSLNAPDSPIWTFTYLGNTFSFDLLSLTNGGTRTGAIGFIGEGIAHATGYTDTYATFSIAGTGTNFQYVFEFSTTTARGQGVPDGGSAVALLGVALAGIEILRRKLRTA